MSISLQLHNGQKTLKRGKKFLCSPLLLLSCSILYFLRSILYEAAKRYILKNFPSGKLPLLKELRAEQRKLKTEKDRLYDKYCEERTSLSEIQDIKKNVDMILGTEYGQQERKRKRPDELV